MKKFDKTFTSRSRLLTQTSPQEENSYANADGRCSQSARQRFRRPEGGLSIKFRPPFQRRWGQGAKPLASSAEDETLLTPKAQESRYDSPVDCCTVENPRRGFSSPSAIRADGEKHLLHRFLSLRQNFVLPPPSSEGGSVPHRRRGRQRAAANVRGIVRRASLDAEGNTPAGRSTKRTAASRSRVCAHASPVQENRRANADGRCCRPARQRFRRPEGGLNKKSTVHSQLSICKAASYRFTALVAQKVGMLCSWRLPQPFVSS